MARAGQFEKGKSGNPAGKPKGARNHVLVALDRIAGEDAEAILNAAITKAKDGDMRAAEVILSRVWPARKGRAVALDLPAVTTAKDLPAALAAIVAAVADGTLTAEEAQAVAGILEIQRRAIETTELEARLTALEAEIIHE
jgi:hypothetical protein